MIIVIITMLATQIPMMKNANNIDEIKSNNSLSQRNVVNINANNNINNDNRIVPPIALNNKSKVLVKIKN